MADDLLVLVQSYAARLLDLVQSLERNNLNTSNDPQTLVIREQIQMFEEYVSGWMKAAVLTDSLSTES